MPRMKRKKAQGGETRRRKSAAGPGEEIHEVTSGDLDSSPLSQCQSGEERPACRSPIDVQQPLHKKIKENEMEAAEHLIEAVTSEFQGKTVTGSSKKLSSDASLPIPNLTKEDPSDIVDERIEVNENDTIRELLQHRKMLLARVRQTRLAAKRRIGTLSTPSISGDEEIAKYSEKMANINALIRKQQAQEPQEKRPVGRRASSVRVNPPKVVNEPSVLEGAARHTSQRSLKRPLPGQAPRNRPKRTPPRIVCPETSALRDKRDELRRKLMNMALKRQPQENGMQVPERRRSSMSVASSRHLVVTHDHSQQKPFFLETEPPVSLPSRRKTHWDTLLQEMKWLATDVREERKWKYAAAKLLAKELLTENTTSPSAEAVDATIPVEENMQADTTEVDKGGISITSFEIVVSDEDAAHARGVATQMSEQITKAVSNVHNEGGIKPSKKRKPEDSVQDRDKINSEIRNGEDLERCTKFINEALSALEKGAATGRRSRSESYGLKLTEVQEHVVLAIEDRWQRIKIGVYVRGPLATGKTVCACSLLWRNRESGPQIVVCSPGSMLRWAHEIERFPGLKALCANRRTITNLASGDVFLCDYSLFSGINSNQFNIFHAAIIDIRHPKGFRGSGINEDFEIHHDTPEELLQSSWWAKLAIISKSCNRIIVGRLDTSVSFLQNGSNRQRLSILGLQLGLLIGVSHFYQRFGYSLEKSILHWGRDAAKSNPTKESKYRKVFSLFSDVIQKCCIKMNDGNRRHSSDEDVWDIRLCEMPALHRIGYQNSCREVFAVLSRGSPSPQNFAKALLVLRQSCVYNKRLVANERASAMKRRLLSASQPNVDAANSLMVNSGKLQELTSILVYEFGMVIPSSALKRLPLGDKKKMKTKGKNPSDAIKRIAILAVSTEVQFLISALLCHLGVLHHLLRDHVKPRSKVPWACHQKMLRSFNEHDGDHPAVLISSPCFVAGDNVGLGIERADAVICVEDDWSGRGELVMQSLTQRNRYRRDAEGLSICRFINLATKDSVEESLLGDGGFASRDKELEAEWPQVQCFVQSCGVLDIPRSTTLLCIGTSQTQAMWESGPFSPSLFSFPARNIFRAANMDLEDLLCAGSIAIVGMRGKRKSTLLSAEGIQAFACFVKELVAGEDRLSGKMASFAVGYSTEFSFLDGPEKICFKDGLCAYLRQSSLAQIEFAPNRQLYQPETQIIRRCGIQNQGADQAIAATASAAFGSAAVLFYRTENVHNAGNRTNIYASVFSHLRRNADRFDQIGEPLVYFPPLFPLVKECSVIAQANVDVIQKQAFSSENIVDPDAQQVKTTHRIVTEEEALHSDAASVLIDLYDDYGLAGLGAIPLPRDSALAAANFSVPALNYRGDGPSGEERVEGSTMVLLTAKKRKRGPSPLQRTSMGWNGMLSKYSSSNGLDISQQSGAMSRSSLSIHNPYKDQTISDSHRHQLLSSLRRVGMGSSMFEAPFYRVASVQIRNKVAGRLLRQDWTPGPVYEAGPGLPLVVAKHQSVPGNSHRGFFDFDPSLWTSVVKRIQNRDVETGAEAVDLSIGQRAAFRRSLVAPCRVDFGPFQCGFLAATGGLSSGAPPRNRVGVALPMGVKISSSMNKEQVSLPWNPEEDRLLHAAAERFCLNWVIAAAELSGSQDVAVVSHAESPRFRAIRAARSCRDRWQRLVRSSPSMLVDVRQSERFTFKPSEPLDKAETIPGKGPSELLIPLIEPSEKEKPAPHQRKRRTFHAFRTSQARTQQPPLQIPGITPGSNHATIVPSHQSHEQHNCKADLCPLNILDSSPLSASGGNRR